MHETNTRTFTAAAAVTKDRLVSTATNDTVAHTALAATPIGVAQNNAAIGEPVAVRLLNAGGTIEIETEGAVADNAVVYARASGLCDDNSVSSAVAFGRSLGSASAAGVKLEVLVD